MSERRPIGRGPSYQQAARFQFQARTWRVKAKQSDKTLRSVLAAGFPECEQHMICPICDATAEQVPPLTDGLGVVCLACGAYDISHTVIATGQLRKLELDRRRDVLDKAKRSARPGCRPMITSYLLD